MNEFAIWNEFGNIYMKIGACDEAISMYRRAIELAPQSGWAYSNMAAACCQQGRFNEAASLYQKAIELLKQDSERLILWNKLGDVYRRLNDYEKAMAAYRRADELETTQVKSGPVKETQKPETGSQSPAEANSQAGELTNWLRDLLESNPSARSAALSEDVRVERPTAADWIREADVPVLRPAREEMKQKLEAPVAPFTAVLEKPSPLASEAQKPALTQAVSPIQVTAEPAPALNTFEKNINIYTRITDINPKNDRAWDTLGLSYKALGRYDEAVKAFEKAITLVPNREVYYYHLGLVYAAQKLHSEAVEAFRKVIFLNPDYVLAHGALAGSCRRLGLVDEAEEHIAIAMPHMQTENEYNRACFEAICGNTAEAIELLALALEKKQTTLEWIRTDPDLDFIRSEPRYVELLCQEVAVV